MCSLTKPQGTSESSFIFLVIQVCVRDLRAGGYCFFSYVTLANKKVRRNLFLMRENELKVFFKKGSREKNTAWKHVIYFYF